MTAILADDGIIDEIAVERAMRGDEVRLTVRERWEVFLRMQQAGCSAAQICVVLGTSERNVARYRARLRAGRDAPRAWQAATAEDSVWRPGARMMGLISTRLM